MSKLCLKCQRIVENDHDCDDLKFAAINYALEGGGFHVCKMAKLQKELADAKEKNSRYIQFIFNRQRDGEAFWEWMKEQKNNNFIGRSKND